MQFATLGVGGPLKQLLHDEIGLEHWLNNTQRLLSPGKKENCVQLVRAKQAVWHSTVPTMSVSSSKILSRRRLQYSFLNTEQSCNLRLDKILSRRRLQYSFLNT